MFIGNQEGIAVYEKLGMSQDSAIQLYFNSMREAAQKYGKVYFSDFIEQRKRPLNNQKMFCLYYEANQWHIDLFHVPDGIQSKA